MLPDNLKDFGYQSVRPLARMMKKRGIHPDTISFSGMVLAAVCAFFLSEGWFAAAAVVLMISGICDMMDGEVARLNHRNSRAGAFLDSCLDRYAEILWFCGLLFFYMNQSPFRQDAVAMLFLGITGSIMVSYARARAEGLNVAGGRVLFERPERVLTLLFGLIAAAIFGDAALLPFIYVLAIGANIGAIYRMRACWMRLQ